MRKSAYVSGMKGSIDTRAIQKSNDYPNDGILKTYDTQDCYNFPVIHRDHLGMAQEISIAKRVTRRPKSYRGCKACKYRPVIEMG